MRFLFSCSPLTGHLLPMLPLARAARRAGHQVIVATGADLRGTIEQHGFTCWPVGPTLAEIYADTGDAAIPDADDRLTADGRRMFIRPSAARAVELIRLSHLDPVDVVVQELYELGAGYVEPQTGVRLVHGLGADFPGFLDLAAMGHAELARTLGGRDCHRQYVAAPYVDPFPAVLHPAPRPWRDIRPIRPEAGAVPAGAQLPDAFRVLPYDRTVYLTLGTVFTSPQAWRGPLRALADLPVNVIATTGNDLDPAALGPLPVNVAAERFVPQAMLLPHCSAVVCHAGAGTVLGALSFGLPLVLLPMGADQFGNAAAVAASGAGVVVDPDQAEPASIRAAVERVLGDDSFRSAARTVARATAELPTADRVLADVLAGTPAG